MLTTPDPSRTAAAVHVTETTVYVLALPFDMPDSASRSTFGFELATHGQVMGKFVVVMPARSSFDTDPLLCCPGP